MNVFGTMKGPNQSLQSNERKKQKTSKSKAMFYIILLDCIIRLVICIIKNDY